MIFDLHLHNENRVEMMLKGMILFTHFTLLIKQEFIEYLRINKNLALFSSFFSIFEESDDFQHNQLVYISIFCFYENLIQVNSFSSIKNVIEDDILVVLVVLLHFKINP